MAAAVFNSIFIAILTLSFYLLFCNRKCLCLANSSVFVMRRYCEMTSLLARLAFISLAMRVTWCLSRFCFLCKIQCCISTF
ncbi:hypothetical protein XENTR_v10009110 [Xenopus tropicalis]|nr:hypothetical protein XENTR_v10009110 [Xenopus tropicalis]